MGDVVEDANVIRFERHGNVWIARIGAPEQGLKASGQTPEVAGMKLLVACQKHGWPWDETWRETTIDD